MENQKMIGTTIFGWLIIGLGIYDFFVSKNIAPVTWRAIPILVGVAFIISGIGILKRKNIARKFILILASLFILVALVAFLTFMPGRLRLIPGLIFGIISLFYFTRKLVKHEFEGPK